MLESSSIERSDERDGKMRTYAEAEATRSAREMVKDFILSL
jgi:hypothetical protein